MEDFTYQEYKECLRSLGIAEFRDLIGKQVLYCSTIHTVTDWYEAKREYSLEVNGYRFYSNPFRIILISHH